MSFSKETKEDLQLFFNAYDIEVMENEIEAASKNPVLLKWVELLQQAVKENNTEAIKELVDILK